MATDVKGLCNASSIMPNNPLTSNGNFSSHATWPSNWPDFAASPGRLGWPARSRHTLACMHRFSHILRWSPVPVVWFMSEWRAVTIEPARKICGYTDHFQQFSNGHGRKRVNSQKASTSEILGSHKGDYDPQIPCQVLAFTLLQHTTVAFFS